MTTARERSFCPPLITRQEALGVTLTQRQLVRARRATLDVMEPVHEIIAPGFGESNLLELGETKSNRSRVLF